MDERGRLHRRRVRCGMVMVCVCLAALWGAGCSAEEGQEGEGARRTFNAKVRAFLLQGEEAFQRGAYQRALALADSAETYGPDVAVTSFFRGSVYTAMNQFDAAEAAYRRTIELDPEYPEARLRMGNNALQRGHLREALSLYEQEEAIAPTAALYEQMGRAYAELGVADSARRAYERAVAMDSTRASAHMKFGQFLEETGELEAALAHSQKALELQPNRPNYQFAVGSQLYQAGRLEAAVEPLKKAAEARLLHYPAQYNLGQVLMRLGREEEAGRYLARADSSRELMEQIDAAQEVVSRDSEAAESWARLGALYRRAGERGRAFQAFNRAATLDPNNLTVQSALGELLLEEGRAEKAIQHFQAMLRVDETAVDAWRSLGLAFATAGDCDNARRAWATVLDRRPGDAAARAYLAEFCQ